MERQAVIMRCDTDAMPRLDRGPLGSRSSRQPR